MLLPPAATPLACPLSQPVLAPVLFLLLQHIRVCVFVTFDQVRRGLLMAVHDNNKQQQGAGARGSRIRECGSHRLSRQHLNKDAAGKSNTCTWWWWWWW